MSDNSRFWRPVGTAAALVIWLIIWWSRGLNLDVTWLAAMLFALGLPLAIRTREWREVAFAACAGIALISGLLFTLDILPQAFPVFFVSLLLAVILGLGFWVVELFV